MPKDGCKAREEAYAAGKTQIYPPMSIWGWVGAIFILLLFISCFIHNKYFDMFLGIAFVIIIILVVAGIIIEASKKLKE